MGREPSPELRKSPHHDGTQATLSACLKCKAQQISSRTGSQTQAVCFQSPGTCCDRTNVPLSAKCSWPEPSPSDVSLHTGQQDTADSSGVPLGAARWPLVSRRSSPSPWHLHCHCLPLGGLLRDPGPGVRDFAPALKTGDEGVSLGPGHSVTASYPSLGCTCLLWEPHTPGEEPTRRWRTQGVPKTGHTHTLKNCKGGVSSRTLRCLGGMVQWVSTDL